TDLYFASYHCGKKGKRVVIGSKPGCQPKTLFFIIALQPRPDGQIVGCNDITMLAIHFHVFTAKGPIPRSLNDSLRLGIMKDYGCLIIHFWINIMLKLLKHRGDSGWLFTIHEPGKYICAVASKVYHSSATITYRVREPFQKLLVNPNLHRPLMAVMYHHFTHLSQRFLFM